MSPKLQIKARDGWRETANQGGPITYVREGASASGQLQFSFATYKPGQVTGASEQTLTSLCNRMARTVQGGKILAARTGLCEFGRFATVLSKGRQPAHFQVWVLSDMQHFILVTHTSLVEPAAEEVTEANAIALDTVLRS